MFKLSISDKAKTILAVLAVAVLGISAWLPQPCPILPHALGMCVRNPTFTPVMTTKEKEENRIPHQVITVPQASFSAKAQEDRTNTAIRFLYYPDQQLHTAYLQIMTDRGYTDLALVIHPLLSHLTWPAVAESNFRIYQRNETYSGIEEALANKGSIKLAADRLAVSKFGLKTGQFEPLESLANLDAVDYVLTSYAPYQQDGDWLSFDRRFDLTNAAVNSEGSLDGFLKIEGVSQEYPFLLSTFHIDYAQRP